MTTNEIICKYCGHQTHEPEEQCYRAVAIREQMAKFMGWKEDPDPEFGWIKPNGSFDVDFDIDRFTTDYVFGLCVRWGLPALKLNSSNKLNLSTNDK
jgi:hypothetical protein